MKKKLLAVLGAAALTLSVAGVALAEDLLAGQVGVHFVLNQPASDSGNLTAAFSNPTSNVGPVANGDPQEANVLHFWVVINGDASTTIDSASTDTDGGNLVVSHVCFGAPAPSATPTFGLETAGITDAPSATPTFGLETAGITDAPTEPTTDALGTTGTSGPADGAWMLVVALGVLLASIVVLTPARAKGKR